MYTLEIVKKSLICVSLASSIASFGFAQADVKKNIDGAVIYDVKDGKYSEYHKNTQDIGAFKYGRTPTKNEIKAWDTDVMPDGTGLPEGSGTVEDGEALYDAQCSMCHGDFGSGGKGYPTLSGGKGTLKNQLRKAGDEPPLKTIGSYWPYATTLFWYIKTAMPFPNPKSLSDNQVYAITAYLLAVNEITTKDGEELDDEFVLNKKSIMDIKMPNKDGFYPVSPDRHDLKEQRGALAQGERCMKDCKTAKVVQISSEIKGFEPPLSTKRDLPKSKETTGKKVNAFAKKTYETSCAACHANKAIGAPVLGDKEAWAEVTKKGLDKVYSNAIKGINAMPPKGGTTLDDAKFKEVVDYMINSSK